MQRSLLLIYSFGLVLATIALGAFSLVGHTLVTRTLIDAIPGLGKNTDDIPLNPSLRCLRVTVRGRVALMVLGYVEPPPEGVIDTCYSHKGELIRLQNGRVVATAGLETNWRMVKNFSLPAWKDMLAQQMLEKVVSVWPGLAMIAFGAGCTQVGPIDGIPVSGYAAIALVLLGSILLMPRAATLLFGFAGVPRAVPLGLAIAQSRGAPGQAMVSLAAIVASFALLEPAFEARVRALPEVARAEFLRTDRLTLDPALRALPGGAVLDTAGSGDIEFTPLRE